MGEDSKIAGRGEKRAKEEGEEKEKKGRRESRRARTARTGQQTEDGVNRRIEPDHKIWCDIPVTYINFYLT